ncbi:hypothetical protein RND71_015195 [Anisodus tanguticus]|uniref:DUF4283 domain-containing protein n=1 Tax=Anisodus tanguticus TaxID=243964 RepID=A0AAE1S607_9SOLA|nr:hypothetical protein RND71_015195 [Anisodus tanguticus]
MAIPATGRPPPEVGHHPPILAHPLNYSNVLKSSPTIPVLSSPETANNGGNSSHCGTTSPIRKTTGKGNPNPPQNTKNPSNSLETPIPATGTVNTTSLAVGNTVQATENTILQKNTFFEISDAGNPTGILGGAGNPTGTLGGAGDPTGTLPAPSPRPPFRPFMAIPASGRPPPEVGLHPTIPTQPLNYSNLFKSAPNIPSIQFSESVNGGTPTPRGTPSPMAISIPLKPIVYLHGEPTIRFEKKEVEVMIHHQDLTMAVVGKFSHGWPDIAFLRTAIPKQCGLKAEVRIGLLCDRHVLIRCTIGEDFDTLMSRQTFEIKEKTKPYLMRTFKWDVTFNPSEESRFAYGWISFPGLSPHYYGESTLFSLAAARGTPIAIDAATLNKTRPSLC